MPYSCPNIVNGGRQYSPEKSVVSQESSPQHLALTGLSAPVEVYRRPRLLHYCTVLPVPLLFIESLAHHYNLDVSTLGPRASPQNHFTG